MYLKAHCMTAVFACSATLACTGSVDGGSEDGFSAGAGGASAPTPALPGMNPGNPMGSVTGATSSPEVMPPSRDPGADLTPITCQPGQGAAAPRRLWRLSETQYKNAANALFYGRRPARPGTALRELVAPFEAASALERFTTYSSPYSMTDFEFRRAMAVASEVAGLFVSHLRGDARSCLGMTTGRPSLVDCVKSLVEQRGPILFNRPLTTEEIDRHVKVAVDALPVLGEDESASLTFQQMLVSPSFLFRHEVGVGAPDADGLIRLTPYETAAALSYALVDAPPDADLWKAAQTGALATPDQVRAQVLRLLGTLGRNSETTLRFLREYFKYDGMLRVFKDASFYRPGDLYNDVTNFVADTVTTNGAKDLLRALLTSEIAYHNRYTAPHYGVQQSSYSPVKITLPPGQRAGILTQPAFLIAFSEMEANLPVQRGRFMSESLLCRPVPELPIGVVPVIPPDPNRTLRERLSAHAADKGCWACHRLLDPMGLALEQYDHLGRLRDIEAGKAIDASGALTDSGNQDGAFSGPLELAHKLAASSVVQDCFLRHSFRYWMGRSEQAEDGCALHDARAAHQRSGGDYRELVAAMFASRSFLYRSVR